jgi:hypothetical protein
MKNWIYRTLALGIGLTAIFATSSLNATAFYSKTVDIPFEFKIGHRVFQAGEYRVEQDSTKDIAQLVNVKTGQRIQVLRAHNGQAPERVKLVFENNGIMHVLKRVS